MKINIDELNKIALIAGEAILEIYNRKDFEIETKSDNSPLTIADKISHKIIKESLFKLYPDIPVLSEEGKEISFNERKKWKKFWLVDPLDGTKEFIKRNGEFTVNIALIEDGNPVTGVIYAPALDTLYYGTSGEGAYKKTVNKAVKKISVKEKSDELTIVKSRSHSSEKEDEFFNKFKINREINKGSSLKFCMVAEGEADIYYRSGPTWEWDIAAGNAIVIAAGGYCMGIEEEINFNKEVMLNKSFIVSNINYLNGR